MDLQILYVDPYNLQKNPIKSCFLAKRHECKGIQIFSPIVGSRGMVLGYTDL